MKRIFAFIRNSLLPKHMQKEAKIVKRYFTFLNKEQYDPPKPADPDSFDKEKTFNRINETIAGYEEEINIKYVKYNNGVGNWRIAASIAVIASILVSVAYYYFTLKDSRPNQLVASVKLLHSSTEQGEVKKIFLPDSTVVWLNANSTLEYPEAFGEHLREVSLTGEAYFEVQKAKERPFIVKSNAVNTKVLGTRFNVKAYENDNNITVGVLSGKVLVNGTNQNATNLSELLTSADVMILNKETSYVTRKKHNNISNSISWIQGRLYFYDVPLSEVVNAIQRKYDVHIQIDTALCQRRIYADFNQESIHSILKILPVMLSCQVVNIEGGYLLTEKSKTE